MLTGSAACVVPPPLQLDSPDAAPNSPPVILSVRGDDAQEYPEQGLVTVIRGQGSFTATLFDVDLQDTLYVRAFVDWTPTVNDNARAQCRATPLPEPSAERVTTCGLVNLCPDAADHDLLIEVYDREVLDTGEPPFRATTGLRTNRTYQLRCTEPPT